jgi:hypothetical protein
MPTFGVKRCCPGLIKKTAGRRRAPYGGFWIISHLKASRRGRPLESRGRLVGISDDPVVTEMSPSSYMGAGTVLPARRLKRFRKPPRLGPFLRGALFRVVSREQILSLVPIHSQGDSQFVGLRADGWYWPAISAAI